MSPARREECRYGIEHEVALVRNRAFVDWRNTTFAELQEIVDVMPECWNDYSSLRVGDLGLKRKRWYIEGFERFDRHGEFVRCDPKGIEIRTVVHSGIDEAVDALTSDFARLEAELDKRGYTATCLSYNPFAPEYIPRPPLNTYEQAIRVEPEDKTAYMHMVTYGPDLNISFRDWADNRVIDGARKLTFYSPYIVPFSFSSPFAPELGWSGLSRRTFYRTGRRPAALGFVGSEESLVASSPSITQLARIPSERGRIEYKALDCCADFTLYGVLLSLIHGLLIDATLCGRATIPSIALHQRAAVHGFADEQLASGARAVIDAAADALRRSGLEDDARRVLTLRSRCQPGMSHADRLLRGAQDGIGIIELITSNTGYGSPAMAP